MNALLHLGEEDMRYTRLRSTRGVTVLELLVVVAIIGILTMLTLPNIPEIIAGHRLRTACNDIVSKLRYIRGLAISKNRELEVTLNIDGRYFLVKQLAYTEYNLIDELNSFDINKALTDETGSTTKPPLKDFKIYSEEPKLLHVIPRWDSDGKAIYAVPINYDFLQTDVSSDWLRKLRENPTETLAEKDKKFIWAKSGIRSMEVKVNGTAATTNQVSFVFYPSGILKENSVVIGIGSKEGAGMATGFLITVYKGGLISSSVL